VEGAGVGFLKKLVLNILFQMKERSSDVFQTTLDSDFKCNTSVSVV